MKLLFKFLAAVLVGFIKKRPFEIELERDLLLFLSVAASFSLFYDLSLFGLFLSVLSVFVLFRLGREKPESFMSIVVSSIFLLPLRAFFPSASFAVLAFSLALRFRLEPRLNFSLSEVLAFSLILLYALLTL